MRQSLAQRLENGRTILLDGGMGTELERRGVDCGLPLWSARALLEQPGIAEQIHGEYLRAGAEILVANTFRTNPRALRAAGLDARGAELNRLAVELARRAAELATATEGEPPIVAASVSPVEDCYRPDLVPDEATLEREAEQMLDWLADARPDVVWIETMGTTREAAAAARAAQRRKLPAVVSFVMRESGELLGGDALVDAVRAVEAFEPVAIGMNCIPPRGMDALLPRLRTVTNRPLLAYAHINNERPTPGWSFAQSVEPEEYATCAARWVEAGVQIVGGCCGTTPEHIRALRERI